MSVRIPHHLLAACFVVLLGIDASNRALRGDDPPPQAEELLTRLWDKNISTVVDIPAFFEETVSRVGKHPQLLQAYAINRIHYFRYRDALPVADELSQIRPGLLDAWMMRCWLNGIIDRFDRALVEVQLYAQHIKQAAADQSDDRKDLQRHAGRLGRLYGFLEGPAKDRLNPASLRETLREIEDLQDDELLTIFEEERQDVLKRYYQLANDRDQAALAAEQDWQAKSAQELETLKQSDEQMVQRREQLQQEMTLTRNDGRQQLDDLSSRMAPLRGEANATSRDLSSLEWNWQAIWQSLSRERAFLLRERDPVLRAIIANRIAELQWQLRGVESDLFAARSHLGNLQQQLASLEMQGRSVSQAIDQQLGSMQNEMSQIQRSQRQNQNRRDKLINGSPPVSADVRAVQDQIKVLSTYDPLPVEAERQRLLEALRRPSLVDD